jgi:hypothetical protein
VEVVEEANEQGKKISEKKLEKKNQGSKRPGELVGICSFHCFIELTKYP